MQDAGNVLKETYSSGRNRCCKTDILFHVSVFSHAETFNLVVLMKPNVCVKF